MGNFSNNAITESGRLLLADVQAGAVFIATKIVMGSGNMPAGKTPSTMTAVVTPVKELSINKKERTPDGKAIYGGVYSNADISTAFYFRELAMYARAEYRDASGAVIRTVPEVLYSYGNAGATADYMPAYSTDTAVEKQMDLVIWVGNDTEIDLTIESGVYVTQAQLANLGFMLASVYDPDGKAAQVATESELNAHMGDTQNPHGVTAAQVGALPLAGGTMTGALTLAADPTAALQAATKQYVDDSIDAIPAPDVSGQISTHNTDTAAHADIRTAVAGKAAKSATIAATLTTADWTGTGPFEQTVNITGMTTQINGIVGPATDITDEQFAAMQKAALRPSAQGTNTLTVKATGAKPSVDLPIQVIIVG